MVTFTCLSLVEMSAISNTNTMDIIFCRNVLMYFTSDWVNKISQNLFNSLSEDGWFVVSSSELSSGVFPQFTPVNFPGAVLYRKTKIGSAHSLSSVAFLTTEASAKVVAKEDLQPSFSVAPAKKDLQLFQPLQLISSEASAKEDLHSIVKIPEES